MVPFMGLQSWVIGQMFGMGFQAGKRQISAMTNLEFNGLDKSKYAFDEMHKVLKDTPKMEQMFAEMRPLVDIMAQEFRKLLESIPQTVGDFISPPTSTGGSFGSTITGVRYAGGQREGEGLAVTRADADLHIKELERRLQEAYKYGASYVNPRKEPVVPVRVKLPTTDAIMIAQEKKAKKVLLYKSQLRSSIAIFKKRMLLLRAQMRAIPRSNPNYSRLEREHRKNMILVKEAENALRRL